MRKVEHKQIENPDTQCCRIANPTEHSKERRLTIRQYEPVEIAAVFFLPFSFAVSEIMLIFAIGNHKGKNV